MTTILLFVTVLVFGILWSIFTNKFLPKETLYENTYEKTSDNTGYDERQRVMFLEIFSKTFVSLVYSFFFIIIFRIFGEMSVKHMVYPFNEFPELIYLIIGAIFLISNYFIVKKKYSG